MTDNEIVKALECCNKSDNGKGCFECPYRQYCPDCLRRRNEDTIDLINRQNAEIERLKAFEKNVYETVKELRNKIKTEAVKEFAERLKEYVESYDVTTGYKIIIVNAVEEETIDNLVKETVSENNG